MAVTGLIFVEPSAFSNQLKLQNLVVTPMHTRYELLFSYGTLRLESVQLSTFGRKLTGAADALVGFDRSMVKIEDQAVVETSGQTHHPIVRYTGHPENYVEGTVFQVTSAELESADRYEVAAYKRVATTLRSGARAWVYVDVRFIPPAL